VQDYRACLLQKPPEETKEEVLLELSQALVKLRRYDEALKFLDQAKETADIEATKIECYYSRGEKGRARRAGLRVLKLKPDHLEGLTWMGTLEAEERNFTQAASYLERAVKSHPQDFTAPYKLAGVYRKMGRTEQADAEMKRMEANRKLREHFTELHEQANNRPDDAQIRYELGATAEKLRLFRLAKMWYQAALALNQKHAKARQALSNLKIPEGEDPHLQ
jgi:tetratricopeptide (TPR) repeat protein